MSELQRLAQLELNARELLRELKKLSDIDLVQHIQQMEKAGDEMLSLVIFDNFIARELSMRVLIKINRLLVQS